MILVLIKTFLSDFQRFLQQNEPPQAWNLKMKRKIQAHTHPHTCNRNCNINLLSVNRSVFKVGQCFRECAKKEGQNVLQLGTSFQCLKLFTDKLLPAIRGTNKWILMIKEIPWRLQFFLYQPFVTQGNKSLYLSPCNH